MRRRRARRRPTVQFYGNLTDRSSIGYVARQVAGFLGSSMHNDCAVQCTTGRRCLEVPAAVQRLVSSADVGVFVGFPRQSANLLWRHKQFVGVYVCEGNRIPHAWTRLLNQHSLVVVPSEYVRRAFVDSGVTVPVRVVRHGLVPEYRPTGIPRLPGFTFLANFNANPFMARKGVHEMFEAFGRLRRDFPGTELVVKTNAFPDMEKWSAMDGVKLITRRYPTAELARLYGMVHAYVQPTRGEGFGLTLLEALACGTPIVVPNHTGVREFVDPERDCLIETDGRLVSMETWDNPVGQLHDVEADAVHAALTDCRSTWDSYERKARSFDPEPWAWHRVLSPLPDILAEVAAMPDRERPASPEVPASPPAPPTPPPSPMRDGGRRPFRSEARRSPGLAAFTPPVLPARHDRRIRLWMSGRQKRAYENDPSGLGVVVRELAARFEATDRQDCVVLAPYNPEHCDCSKFSCPVVAYTTFESDRWPEWWVESLNQCLMVIVPQEWVRKALVASGCTVPVRVIPQAPKRFPPPLRRRGKGEKYTFGFLGVPVGRKNLDMVLRCAPATAKVLVHSAWWPKGVERPCRAEVEYSVGRLDDDTLYRRFWSRIDCLVAPSAGEGYSMVVREAVAMGIPVILSDIPAHADVQATKIRSAGPESAFYEFCARRIGHWTRVDERDLEARMADAEQGLVTSEGQSCPNHDWDETAAAIRAELDFRVATYAPPEAEGGGIDRFASRLADEWTGLRRFSDLRLLDRFAGLVEWLVLQFEYGVCRQPALAELRRMKEAHGFRVMTLVHAASENRMWKTANEEVTRLSDEIVLLNPAQRRVFPDGFAAEHPWPTPAPFRRDAEDRLGTHGNLHPQKGYRHLFALARVMGLPVVMAGPYDPSNVEAARTHREQVAPNALPGDRVSLRFFENEELRDVMGGCRVLVYPYEPWVNVQASGALRDAVTFGRPAVCSDCEDYFDPPPEAFPRIPLNSPEDAARVTRAVAEDAEAVFARQAAHARKRSWSWFVALLKSRTGVSAP